MLFLSFFITPQNYFDFDVSIESSNAILLSPPQALGQPWRYYDNGVKDADCVPDRLPQFEYKGVKAIALEGELVNPPEESPDMWRKEAEMYHRIQLEL